MQIPKNVLFLCTGNSARSILGEALLNRLGSPGFKAFSAGSQPKGDVHPAALQLLGEAGFPVGDLHSKSWDEFSGPDAPVFDYIFTVCDNAAGEACPIWPGHPMVAHWGIEDPAAAPVDHQPQAFAAAFGYLEDRISRFLALPFDSLDQKELRERLRDIGRGEGATAIEGASA